MIVKLSYIYSWRKFSMPPPFWFIQYANYQHQETLCVFFFVVEKIHLNFWGIIDSLEGPSFGKYKLSEQNDPEPSTFKPEFHQDKQRQKSRLGTELICSVFSEALALGNFVTLTMPQGLLSPSKKKTPLQRRITWVQYLHWWESAPMPMLFLRTL